MHPTLDILSMRLIDGAYAGDFFSGGDKIDLTIVGHESFAQRTQDLK